MNQQKAIKTTINLYSGLGWKSLFAKIRFWDAPFEEVEALVPKIGRIIDLGCGEGILANYLAVSSAKRKIFGIDINKKRIKDAFRGLPNTKFILGDVTEQSVPKGDVILLVHLLHHLNSPKDQDKLLAKCITKLKNGGKLVIVEVEPKPTFKYIVAWFTDHFLVPWIFERRLYSSIFFRKSKEWIRLLENLGMHCSLIPAENGKPFTHIIFNCTKN